MAGRRIPIAPDISRQDIADAIKNLRNELLDPDRPSMLSTMNARFDEHAKTVDKVIARFDEFVDEDYRPFKADVEKDRNRTVGYIAGAGAVGAVMWSFIKKFLGL